MKPNPRASSYLRQFAQHGLGARPSGVCSTSIQSQQTKYQTMQSSTSNNVLNIDKRTVSMTQVSNSRNRLSDVERQGRKRKKKLVRKENYNTDPTVALTQDEDPYDWLIRREQVEMEGVSVHSEAALIEGERLSNTLRYLLKLDYDGTRDSIYATNGNFNGFSWMHVKTGAHIAYSKEHQDHLNYLHHITKDAPRITKASQLRAIFDSLRKIEIGRASCRERV